MITNHLSTHSVHIKSLWHTLRISRHRHDCHLFYNKYVSKSSSVNNFMHRVFELLLLIIIIIIIIIITIIIGNIYNVQSTSNQVSYA